VFLNIVDKILTLWGLRGRKFLSVTVDQNFCWFLWCFCYYTRF